MRKIFITGANGFVGRNLIQAINGKFEIIAYDIIIPGKKFSEGIEWLPPNDLNDNLLEERLRECDTIVHLAQSPYYREFPEKAKDIFDTNVHFVLQLFDAARTVGLKNIILFSSGGIYGNSNNSFHELEQPNPIDFYLATKAMSEFIAKKYREFMAVHILRPFFIYGPGQKNKLIPILIERIKEGKEVFINGLSDGGRINPVFIDDVVSAVTELLEMSDVSSTVNLAGPDILSVRQIIDIISQALGRKPIVVRKPEEEELFMIGDIARVKNQLPSVKLVSFYDGIKQTLARTMDYGN
jgi:nucleoside-diphosphate-sugar epimerase